MFINAVFQGGGVKGIALVGALQKIEEMNIKFSAVSGTSAGSIVAALYACGYSALEMKTILEEMDLKILLDPPKFGKFRFMANKGLYKGDQFYKWIYNLLKKKGISTFEDLNDIELNIIASDLTNRELLVFNHHAYPKMNIAEAVRMSISIPLFFMPKTLGERLIVDGGVLSNYPLFTFNDPETTLGFKLIANTDDVPQQPKTFRGYIISLVNTMLDAHDKDDELRGKFNNVIKIDDGGISSINFSLSTNEKDKLYKNGYFSASKFVNDNAHFFENIGKKKLSIQNPILPNYEIQVPDNLQPEESIRLSISALVKIHIDGKYLLVKGNRIDQYQPVGGVLKRFEKEKSLLNSLSVLDDDKLPIDETSNNDLRVRVPLTSLVEFLKWYRQAKGRETSPWREFYEELIETEFLPSDSFKFIDTEHIKTHIEGIRFSTHFNCHELLIAEIFELIPNENQKKILRELQQTYDNDRFMWCDGSLILTKGFDQVAKKDLARISETSTWLL